MAKRERLTSRNRQAVDGSIPYPGNVNQPDRKFKTWEEYHTFVQRINHELPDMAHDWQNDERDEIGFGIPEAWGESPTVASVRTAANKSIKLAYLLLGEKVAEDVIERQATEFMLLGPEALDNALTRFASTQKLYAADETEEEADDAAEGKEASVTASDDADEDDAAEEATTASDDADEDDAEEAKEASVKPLTAADVQSIVAAAVAAALKTSSEELAEEGAVAAEVVEDTGADEKEASTKEVTAGDDGDEDDADEEATTASSRRGMNDMDIELTSSMDDAMSEAEPDARLAGLFDDGIPAELPEPGTGREASEKKQGIKSLGGGQPKVASGDGGAADMSSLWGDAPDVSEIFR